jgi:hypothetical protein
VAAGTATVVHPSPLHPSSTPRLGVIEREVIMKSRLFFRTLCVGAALLVPAGGLTVLGVGTAGASTTIHTVATSNAKLGSLGTMTLITITCHTPVIGTNQCTAAGQFKLTAGHITVLLTGKLLVTIITTAGTKKIHKMAFKSGATGLLKKTAATTAKFTGCTVASLPAITYAATGGTGLKWAATNVTLSGTTITGTCTTKTFLQMTDINGHKISSTLTFNAA